MKREIIEQFQGKDNVTHVITDNGVDTYLTQSHSFVDEANAKGASSLNTVENETKHALFLFNEKGQEVGRYYLGKKLQGKTPEEIAELKHSIVVFESWNPDTKRWVPCVSIKDDLSVKGIASKAIPLNYTQTSKMDVEEDNLSTKVTDDDIANAWTDEYGVMYSPDKKRLLRISDELISYSIRKGTQVICDKAFNWIDNEDSYVFSYNNTLESIIIPDSVVQIGSNAFRNCATLRDVVLSDYLIQIGENAFSGCKSLTAINLPVTLREIGDAAFCGCDSLTSINIPNTIYRLGDSVFSECAFSQISIPNTIREIGNYAFYRCRNLKKVKIPDSVKKFGVGVFGGCPLMEVNLPNSITELGFEFFSGSAFSQLILPRTIKRIGDRAFYGSHLTQITIPDSISFIGESAFENSCLQEITLPNTIKEIADLTFAGSSLKKIEIPNSLTKIGHLAFDSCQFLNNVVVPDSVLEIGNGVFKYCDSLTMITFLGKVSQVGNEIFKGCNSLTQIIIPDGSKDHYARLLPEYQNNLVEIGGAEKAINKNNSVDFQILDHFSKTTNRSVKTTSHLLLLQQLVNNSLYWYRHPSSTSDLPSFMWNDEGIFMESDSILPYTIPFLWVRTLAKRNVEKFNEVMDLLYKEFGVEVSEEIDVKDIVLGIKKNGFSEFSPNFDVHVNKKLLSTFYSDCLNMEKFILFFCRNFNLIDLLPSQNNQVSISAASILLNKMINEMVGDFRNNQLESN